MLPISRKLLHEQEIRFEVLGRLFPDRQVIIVLRECVDGACHHCAVAIEGSENENIAISNTSDVRDQLCMQAARPPNSGHEP